MKKNIKIGIAALLGTLVAGKILTKRNKSCSHSKCSCYGPYGLHSCECLHCSNKMGDKDAMERLQNFIENKLDVLKQKIAKMP